MTRILVVDDLADSAQSLALLLETCGHEASVAFDGAQGVRQAEMHRPHIIFLDLDMPVMDGLGAARAIRASPRANQAFIVALSAKVGTDVERETADAGFDFYIQKPANTNALLALVDDLKDRVRTPVV